MSGLFLDRTNNSWKTKVKIDGAWKSKTLGKGDGTNLPPHDVQAKFAALSPAPTIEVAAPSVVGSLRAFADCYLRDHPSQKKNGKRRRESVLRRFCDWAEFQGYHTLQSIGVTQVKAWDSYRRNEEGASPDTVVSDLACIQGMFKEAVIESIVNANPVTRPASLARTRVRSAKAANRDDDEEIKYYPIEQMDKILAIMPLARQKYRELALVMLATGMRVEAARHLESKWIDPEYWVKIPAWADKGGSGYTTHIFTRDTAEVRTIIDRRMREHPSGTLFPDIKSDTAPWHYWDTFFARHRMKDIVELGCYNHAWRHTFAVRRVENGMPIPILQKLMGHHDIRITMRYAQVSNHAMREAVYKVENPEV